MVWYRRIRYNFRIFFIVKKHEKWEYFINIKFVWNFYRCQARTSFSLPAASALWSHILQWLFGKVIKASKYPHHLSNMSGNYHLYLFWKYQLSKSISIFFQLSKLSLSSQHSVTFYKELNSWPKRTSHNQAIVYLWVFEWVFGDQMPSLV